MINTYCCKVAIKYVDGQWLSFMMNIAALNTFMHMLLLLRTPSNDSFKRSLRPILLTRSLIYSLQFNFIIVYCEVAVLLRWWTFYCNWRTTSFCCIVLCYIIQEPKVVVYEQKHGQRRRLFLHKLGMTLVLPQIERRHALTTHG